MVVKTATKADFAAKMAAMKASRKAYNCQRG